MGNAQNVKSPKELFEGKLSKAIDKAVEKYRKKIDGINDENKKENLLKDLTSRVVDAKKILLAIRDKSDSTAIVSEGTVKASYFDGLVDYSMTVLKIKYDPDSELKYVLEKELEPCVIVICKALGHGYFAFKYKNEAKYKENNKIRYESYVELFDQVIKSVSNLQDNGLSNADIDVEVSHELSWSNRLQKNPDSKFIDLIDKHFPDVSEADKEKYYLAYKKGKVVKINPLKILQDSDEVDYSFERELRQLIISLTLKKSEDDLKKFFMPGDETCGLEDDVDEGDPDEVTSMENNSDGEEEQPEEQAVSHKTDEVVDYGNDYYNSLMNECIRFREDKVKADKDLFEDEKEIRDYVKEVLTHKGKENVEVYIDDRGVIKYTFEEKDDVISGYIGQVFFSKTKLIKTKFLVDKSNYWFVPEYRAYIERKTGKDNRSLEERTHLSGYMQQLKELIYLRITADLTNIDEETIEVGTATSLNEIYRKLFDARFKYDYLGETKDIEIYNKLDLSMRQKIVETLSRKVRYSDFYSEGSMSINALVGYEYSKKEDEDPKKEDEGLESEDLENENLENGNEYYNKGENIYLIDGTKRYFDPEATSSGKIQGSARYLVESASVNSDGTIEPGESGDRTPIFNDKFLKDYSKFNPFDRNQMVFSNLMRAYNITEPVGTALMTCGGWNMEDAFVISKEFAEKYQVPNNHPDEKHTGPFRPLMVGDKMLDRGGNKGVISVIIDRHGNDESLSELTKLFEENPDLHVIASPYSGLSRFNGATARELMENSNDLTYRGKMYEKCMGKAQYIITRQFADVKTKIYDEEKYRKGESRQASAQLSWALCSKDAREMLCCLYKVGERAEKDLKDVASLVSVVSGRHYGYSEQTFEAVRKDQKNDKELYKKKVEEIDKILNSNDNKDGCRLSINFGTGFNLSVRILPQSCRPGYTDNAGRHIESEITKMYRELLLSNTKAEAEKKYWSIRSLLSHEFYGKNNIFKTRLMTRSVKYSATAIWTPDPRLPIESIAISNKIAEGLNVKEGDYLLIWRDPVLRDSNVRYMKVERIDDGLTGIAINPVMAKGFDGDFDGDTVAVVNISYDAKAHEEAIRKFSVENNLLDEGRTNRPLSINTKLDLISAGKANELEDARKEYFEGEKSAEETLNKINGILQEAFKEDYCLDNAMIRLNDNDSVIKSLEEIEASGAKKGIILKYKEYFNNVDDSLSNDERMKVQKATAIKAAVGIAGRYSQQLMRAFREICPKAVLELTYPNTQALLQIKHDPDKAVEVYITLKCALMKAWEIKQMAELLGHDRKKEIKDLYDILNQPIGGEDGIDEKYLNEIIAAVDHRPLSECHGTYLDELAYLNRENAWKDLNGYQYRALYDYFDSKFSTDKFENKKEFLLEAVTENSEVIRCIPRKSDYYGDKDIVLAAVKKNGLALRHVINTIEAYQTNKVVINIVKAAVENCGYAINFVPDYLKNNEEIKNAVNKDQKAKIEGIEGLNYDPDIVRAAVSQNGMALEFAPAFQDDEEIVRIAVSQNGKALKYSSKQWMHDPDMVRNAVSQNGLALEYVPVDQITDEIVEIAVKQNGTALRYAPEDLKNNKGIVLTAVSQDGFALKYASGVLKDDKEIVLTAVSQDGLALDSAPDDYKNDKEIVLTAVSQNGSAYEFAVPRLQKDEEIVKAAVSNYGHVLEYAEKFWKDFDIVKEAVSNRGEALKWASAGLKQNREIVIAAVSQYGQALQFSSIDLRKDKEVVLAAVSQDGLALDFAPDLANDEEIVRTAVSQNGLALDSASEHWKHDNGMVRSAVLQNGRALQFASDDLKNDKEIVLAAISQKGTALQFASEDLKSDKEIVLAAVSQSGMALEYVPVDQITDEIVKIAVSQNGLALEFAPDDYKNDREVVSVAVSQDGTALQFASADLKNDKELVLAAVSQNAKAMEFAPDYQSDKDIALIVVKQDGLALRNLTDRIKNDEGEMITEISDSYLALKNASEEEKHDRDFVLEAVREDGMALKFASDNLKNDRNVVLAALSNDYRALQYSCTKRYSDCFISTIKIHRYL